MESNIVSKTYDYSYLEKIEMENKDDFEILIIKPGSIKNVSWFDPNYAFNLFELDLFELVKVNCDNFLETIGNKLNVNMYQIKDVHVKTEIIGEQPYYLYEMCYIDLEKETSYHSVENELASLLNINGDKIYSNVIIFKNYLPSLSDSMTLTSVSKKDVATMLHERVHTSIVLYDGQWYCDKCVGDLNEYAKIFFDDEKYEKIEIGFLMHNINIWYIPEPTNFTNQSTQINQINTKLENVCGNLLNIPISKCIWFSMKSDEYRGNLTLDEVQKIIYLSKILSNYQTPSDYTVEKIDKIGRKIVYNKYKVLDLVYQNNLNI